MPLRLLTPTLVLLTILLAQHTALAQPAQTVTEKLPWFAAPGLTLAYKLSGSYQDISGQQVNYAGAGFVRVVGVEPNGSLVLEANATTTTPALPPSGTSHDDPFFPAYLPVLPSFLVIPEDFSVLTPSYALFFHYLGSSNYTVNGTEIEAYDYSVFESLYGQPGVLPIEKYLSVDPQTGIVVNFTLANTATKASNTAVLEGYTKPSSSPGEITLSVPKYAAPGSYLVYQSTAQQNAYVTYKTIYAEPDGTFMFERSVETNGVSQGSVFYLDNYTSPIFYPATNTLGKTVVFPASQGEPLQANLTLLGSARVNTPAGSVSALAYANKTIGFEAYVDPNTGVAVILELPGGFLELKSSNFIQTSTPTLPPTAYAGLAAAALTAVLAAWGIARGMRRHRRTR